MASMTIPQRISDFLSQRQERMYCDTCIQERLGLKWRQQVQLITATLAVTTAFRREFNKCCTCEEIKQVTHAVGGQPQPAPTPPQQSTKKLTVDLAPRRKHVDAVDAHGLDMHFTATPVQRADHVATTSRVLSAHRRDAN